MIDPKPGDVVRYQRSPLAWREGVVVECNKLGTADTWFWAEWRTDPKYAKPGRVDQQWGGPWHITKEIEMNMEFHPDPGPVLASWMAWKLGA